MPLSWGLRGRDHDDRHAHEDHLFEMFGVSGTVIPETPNIYLIFIFISGYLGHGWLVARGTVALKVALT
jgi:hypothetical protein